MHLILKIKHLALWNQQQKSSLPLQSSKTVDNRTDIFYYLINKKGIHDEAHEEHENITHIPLLP